MRGSHFLIEKALTGQHAYIIMILLGLVSGSFGFLRLVFVKQEVLRGFLFYLLTKHLENDIFVLLL